MSAEISLIKIIPQITLFESSFGGGKSNPILLQKFIYLGISEILITELGVCNEKTGSKNKMNKKMIKLNKILMRLNKMMKTRRTITQSQTKK